MYKALMRRMEERGCAVGTKFDGDKLRYDLYPLGAYEGCTKVITFGAKKYAPDNWKLVKPKSRYYAALIRHVNAQILWEQGGKTGLALDEETGLPHLDHAQCCLIFFRELSKDEPKRKDKESVQLQLVGHSGDGTVKRVLSRES